MIVTYLTPKSIVSEKPLTIKKQKALFTSQTTSLLSAIKVTLFIILQKGHLITLYGSNRTSIVYSDDDEEMKLLFKKEYKIMVCIYRFIMLSIS